MGRISASLLALALGAFAAVALASCGSQGSAKLLPGDTAAEITANLEKVKRLAQSEECVGAEDAAQQIGSQIDALGGVDKTLKKALREGATRLNEVVSKCGEGTTETVETSEEETTETTPGKPAKKEEKPKKPKPTPSEPPTTKTTTTQTTPTTPTTTTTPTTEGGGVGAPSGGVGPGAPVGGGR